MGKLLILPAWQKGIPTGEQMVWKAGDTGLKGCGEGDDGTSNKGRITCRENQQNFTSVKEGLSL